MTSLMTTLGMTSNTETTIQRVENDALMHAGVCRSALDGKLPPILNKVFDFSALRLIEPKKSLKSIYLALLKNKSI